MILALRLWLRRSTARLAFPGMVVIALIILFGRSGWAWEIGHAVNQSTTAVIILGPVAAGLVAFDIWRRQTSAMRTIAATTRRGARGTMALAGATLLYATLAWFLGVGVALTLAARNGAAGSLPWWILGAGMAALVASVGVGAAIGTLMRNVAAAPVAALLCYALPIAGTLAGVDGIMRAGGATTLTIGITTEPTVAAASIMCTVLIGAVAWRAVVHAAGPRRVSVLVGTAGLAIMLVGGLGYLQSLDPMSNAWRQSSTEVVCAGTAPKVCGPSEGKALYELAARDLGAAGQVLAGDGISIGARFDYVRGFDRPAEGAGMLLVDSGSIQPGHLGRSNVVSTISRPTACDAFRDDLAPEDLLAAQGNFMTWLDVRLSGDGGTDPADIDGARQTLEALATCDEEAIPAWTFSFE